MRDEESVTDYLIKVAKVAMSLENAGEVISDSLQVTVVLKGLSPDYKTFCYCCDTERKRVDFHRI